MLSECEVVLEGFGSEFCDCAEGSPFPETFIPSLAGFSLGSAPGTVPSTLVLVVWTTGLGGLAELKYLPPPGFEEKKEE